MGEIGDITNLLSQVYKTWKELKGERSVSRQELFDKYIQPSYLLLKEIHSDYLDLYCELEERINIDGKITYEIIQWFSKARLKRQVDRSELQLIKLPKMKGNNSKSNDLNELLATYISTVKAYFMPPNIRWSQLVYPSSSRSSVTEEKLQLAMNWLTLNEFDQMLFIAEERLKDKFKNKKNPELLPNILNELISYLSKEDTVDNSELLEVAKKRTINIKDAFSAIISPTKLKQIEQNDFEFRTGRSFGSVIIENHIHNERWSLQASISEVQKVYVKLRILLDRS